MQLNYLLDLKRVIGPPMVEVVAQAAYNKCQALELAEYLPPLRLLQSSHFLRSLKRMLQKNCEIVRFNFYKFY